MLPREEPSERFRSRFRREDFRVAMRGVLGGERGSAPQESYTPHPSFLLLLLLAFLLAFLLLLASPPIFARSWADLEGFIIDSRSGLYPTKLTLSDILSASVFLLGVRGLGLGGCCLVRRSAWSRVCLWDSRRGAERRGAESLGGVVGIAYLASLHAFFISFFE